jgi:hypothetical protein
VNILDLKNDDNNNINEKIVKNIYHNTNKDDIYEEERKLKLFSKTSFVTPML